MFSDAIKKVLAAGLAASGLVVATSGEVKASTAPRPSVTQRVQDLRSKLAQVEAELEQGSATDTGKSLLSTWVNCWNNWGNWGNWGNWNNWHNFWTNWSNWGNAWCNF